MKRVVLYGLMLLGGMSGHGDDDPDGDDHD